jgi:hypothetical protein
MDNPEKLTTGPTQDEEKQNKNTTQYVLDPLYVFTIRVPCYDVCYDSRMETMLDSSLPPVVYRRTRVLFASFLYATRVLSNAYLDQGKK